ncbi:hypothetical protein Tco_1554780 [Tanacetum coccineum]
MTDNTALLQELQAIQQQLQQQSQQLQHQSQLLQQHSQQQRKQKARILDAVENLNFRVRKTNQLLHKEKIIGFPTHRSCAPPLLNSFDTHDLLRVVPTYHQDEDDQDAQHKVIQDDNPTITEVIHVEYSLNNNFKIETPMVIEEDEKLLVFTSTKVQEQPMENKSIDPKELESLSPSTIIQQNTATSIVVPPPLFANNLPPLTAPPIPRWYAVDRTSYTTINSDIDCTSYVVDCTSSTSFSVDLLCR